MLGGDASDRIKRASVVELGLGQDLRDFGEDAEMGELLLLSLHK
jgi:hypothetical protein